MIHDWLVYDDEHQACRRCGLRLWRRGAGSWNAVTANGVPAPFGLLPDGSRIECVPPRNFLGELVVIDYTGDPDRFPGCERFMHRIRGGGEPGEALASPAAAPTACGYPAVGWEIGPARVHPGWTWCADCYPDRPRARGRVEQAPAAELGLRQGLPGWSLPAPRAPTRKAKLRAASALRYCYCGKCAGGWPSQAETIRAIKSIRRRPQGWNPR